MPHPQNRYGKKARRKNKDLKIRVSERGTN